MSIKIVADPGVCFGAYRLADHRITVRAVVDRFVAGESVAEIAADYGIEAACVEECLRWRLRRKPYAPPMGGRAPQAWRRERRGGGIQTGRAERLNTNHQQKGKGTL